MACAIGSGIGTLTALEFAEISKWLWICGIILGGLAGYLSFEFKRVLLAIPQAARSAWTSLNLCTKRTRVNIQLLMSVREFWKMILLYHLGVSCCLLAHCFVSYYFILSTYHIIGKVFVLTPLEGVIILATSITGSLGVISLLGLLDFGLPVATLISCRSYLKTHHKNIESQKSYETTKRVYEQLFESRQLHYLPSPPKLIPPESHLYQQGRWKILLKINPIAVYCYWPIWGIVWFASRLILLTIFISRFTRNLFILIHSDWRLLCGIDSLVGATAGFLLGNVFWGMLIGGLTGLLNYEILSVRILKLVPERIQKQ